MDAVPTGARRIPDDPEPGPAARAGFSLVETGGALVALAVLLGVFVPLLAGTGEDPDERRAHDLERVRAALESYRTETGAYPSSGDRWVGDAPRFGGRGYGPDGYVPGLVPTYLEALPSDPDPDLPRGTRGYLYRSDGTDYKLLAHKTPHAFPEEHPLFDPRRPSSAWQVSSPGARDW